jgi:hypothetical protein
MTFYNKNVDWKKIERLYRAGVLSVREIAREFNMVEGTIRYHANKKGWKRDLSHEARQAYRQKTVENLAKVFDSKELGKQLDNITDEEIIEEAAKTQIEVVRQHQRTLGQGHQLTMRLLRELEDTTAHMGELQELITSEYAPQRREAVRRAISLPSRATTLRDLAAASRLWVTLERQAFNILDDREKSPDQRKVDEMSAEELRAEIRDEAKKIGLDLTTLSEEEPPRERVKVN